MGGLALLGLAPEALYAEPEAQYVFDLHTHPGIFPQPGWQGAAVDLLDTTLAAMSRQHVRGGFFSLVADLPLIRRGPNGIKPAGRYAPGAAWMEYKRQLDTFRKITTTGLVEFTRSAGALQNSIIAGFLSVEGGDFLEGSTERIEEMHRDGVTSIQLVHYIANELGDLQTAPPLHQGLSNAGAEVVRKMNEIGMVIDVAHASFQTVKNVVDITTHPILLSHSLLEIKDSKQRPISARTISSDHARIVAGTGGLIGAWPSGYNESLDEFAVNIMRLADLVGIEHVGIGTDMDANFKPVLDSYDKLPELAALLRSHGMQESDVHAIFSGNAIRLLKTVLRN